MGLLNDDYYSNLIKQKQSQAVVTPDSQPAAPDNRPVLQKAEDALIKPLDKVSTPAMAKPDLTAEQTAANMAKTGTGHFLGREIGSTLGLEFPDEQTWDGMSGANKASYTTFAGLKALGKMVVRLPRQIVKAPIKVVYNVVKPWSDMVQGKSTTYDAQSKSEGLNIPWIGNVSSYFKDFSDARKSGQGPLLSTLSTGANALGDVTIAASLAESLNSAMRPRAKLNPGEQVANTKPIEKVLSEQGGKPKLMQKPEGSPNEYYSLPKTVAKKYGGGSNDTFLKVSPANVIGDTHSMEVSVVKLRGGMLKEGVDYVKGKFGVGDKITQGDFGPEVKMEGQIVPTNGKITKAAVTPEGTPSPLESIPPSPLKGFENKPINETQLNHLDQIGAVNKIDPNIAQKVIENVTGKSSVGDLTQAEYVKVAQTLGVMGETGKYLGENSAFINPAAQYLSPTRRFFRNVEETHGHPIYSDAYVPMEDAATLERTFVDKHDVKLNDIFSKDATGNPLTQDYNGSKFAEERRLVKSYVEGNTDAILKNDSLTPAAKQDLVTVSDNLKKFYDETGPALGIDPEYFLKNYQPHIQNIGGIYQLYKEGSEIPKSLDFFAEHKRSGALTTQVDDALALAQIYTRAGAKKMFTNPVLERVMGMYDKLPPTLQNSVKAYIQEKMGYAGRVEQALNDMVPALNQKLGISLPVDAARRITQTIMDTTYSGALGLRPDAIVRNSFQAPLIVYPRLGPKFYGQATLKALTPAGMAELSEKGFLVKLGVPYGEELTKDVSIGGKVANGYRKFTQATLKGYEYSDAFTRGTAYFQGKYQWEDALKRYNDGKLDWAGVEKDLDLKAFSPIDRNIIRQKLVAGDQEGAFNHFIRDIIDETNFPYRSGAAPRATYGLGGKLISQFSQWPIEYAHTIGSWVKTGQWDKVIRMYAAAAGTKRTVEDTLNLNLRKWVGVDPLNLSVPPFVKLTGEIGSFLDAHMKNDKQAINKAQDQIINEIKSLGVPVGVEAGRVQRFWKSISLSKKDKLPQGTWGIYDGHGKLTDTTDFANLFWGTLWGFPTSQNVNRQDVQQDMINAKYDYSQAKANVLELYRQEKYDEANKIIQEHGIQLTPSDFDAYYIPLDQRTFQSLPASLKPQFAPKVYPSK